MKRLEELEARPIGGTQGARSPFFSPRGSVGRFLRRGRPQAQEGLDRRRRAGRPSQTPTFRAGPRGRRMTRFCSRPTRPGPCAGWRRDSAAGDKSRGGPAEVAHAAAGGPCCALHQPPGAWNLRRGGYRRRRSERRQPEGRSQVSVLPALRAHGSPAFCAGRFGAGRAVRPGNRWPGHGPGRRDPQRTCGSAPGRATPISRSPTREPWSTSPGGRSQHRSTLVSVDRAGKVRRRSSTSARYRVPRVSPDGRQVAVTLVDQQVDVWTDDRLPEEHSTG